MPNMRNTRDKAQPSNGSRVRTKGNAGRSPSPRFADVINRDNLHRLFTYQNPTPAKNETYQQIRDAGYAFANTILALTPPSGDQQAALQCVREAVMRANAAIALDGAV